MRGGATLPQLQPPARARGAGLRGRSVYFGGPARGRGHGRGRGRVRPRPVTLAPARSLGVPPGRKSRPRMEGRRRRRRKKERSPPLRLPVQRCVARNKALVRYPGIFEEQKTLPNEFFEQNSSFVRYPGIFLIWKSFLFFCSFWEEFLVLSQSQDRRQLQSDTRFAVTRFKLSSPDTVTCF